MSKFVQQATADTVTALQAVNKAVDHAIDVAVVLRAHVDYDDGVIDSVGAVASVRSAMVKYLHNLAAEVEAGE